MQQSKRSPVKVDQQHEDLQVDNENPLLQSDVPSIVPTVQSPTVPKVMEPPFGALMTIQ